MTQQQAADAQRKLVEMRQGASTQQVGRTVRAHGQGQEK